MIWKLIWPSRWELKELGLGWIYILLTQNKIFQKEGGVNKKEGDWIGLLLHVSLCGHLLNKFHKFTEIRFPLFSFTAIVNYELEFISGMGLITGFDFWTFYF